MALDKRTGEELWKVDRDELDTWATPVIVEHGGRAQVVTSGWSRIRSYDLETGELVWHTTGLTPLPISSPVAEGWDGHRDQRVQRQYPEGDQSG